MIAGLKGLSAFAFLYFASQGVIHSFALPESASVTASSTGSSQPQHTDVTMYTEDWNGKGACGSKMSTKTYWVAIPKQDFKNATDTNGNCGKTVMLTYKGKTVNGYVADKCEECGSREIAISLALFKALGGEHYTQSDSYILKDGQWSYSS